MDQQAKAHYQKWNRWNRERKLQQNNQAQKEKNQTIPPKSVSNNNGPNILNKQKQKYQTQSHCCALCLQMMLPPYNPIMLTPCEHSVCKMCIFENPNASREKFKLKINKCPICRKQIQSHSVNVNLMNYILKQSQIENQKEKYMKQEPILDEEIETLRTRCVILSSQRQTLKAKLAKDNKEVQILEAVTKTLSQQRKRIELMLEKLDQQDQLVDKHSQQNARKLKLIRRMAEQTEQKYFLIDKTLQPLLLERQKKQIFKSINTKN